MIIKLNSIDITNEVSVKNFRKTDHYNSRSDEFYFTMEKIGGTGTEPKGADIIELIHKGNTVYYGTVLRVQKELNSKGLVTYKIEGKSPEHDLGRKDVVEQFYNVTVNDIIKNSLIPDYAPSYTTTNVNSDINVGSISFNHITLTECLNKLAKHTNFYWYVDYDKDIHFFAKNSELAPENISDISPNHIAGSLYLQEDYSQIKNAVILRGGSADALEDTKEHTGNGSNKKFGTDLRFTETPTVTVNSVVQSVGIAYLNDIADFDCLWSYQEKFITFATPPANGDAIEFTGIPEAPILVKTSDPNSISKYGEWEYYMRDENITSRSEAYKRAIAEMNASKEKTISGRFSTYTEGFRSGQTVSIQNSSIGIEEDFIINKVMAKLLTPDDGTGNAKFKYDITVTTDNTIGVIEFLQDRLFEETLTVDNTDTLLSFETIYDTMGVGDSVGAESTTSPPYVWGTMKWGYFTWS